MASALAAMMSAVGGLQKSIGSLEAPFFLFGGFCGNLNPKPWGFGAKRFCFLAPPAQEVELPIDSAPLAVEEKARDGRMEFLKGSGWMGLQDPSYPELPENCRAVSETGTSTSRLNICRGRIGDRMQLTSCRHNMITHLFATSCPGSSKP